MNYNERRAAVSWQRFRDRVEELGGTVLEDAWKGSQARYSVRCPAGHMNDVIANNVSKGQGICRVCAKNEPEGAWQRFRDRVEELGGTVLEDAWKGSQARHRIRCVAGHEVTANPAYVGSGGGICAGCAELDPAVAWKRFRDRVEELGGTVLEDAWKGSQQPHAVRCAEGHECSPMPNSLTSGAGVCRVCAGKIWDAFYVVTDGCTVKFGITSGDPAPRLRKHAATGLTDVIRLSIGMPPNAAPWLESQCLTVLRESGAEPVRGREYFDVAQWGDLILGIVDRFS